MSETNQNSAPADGPEAEANPEDALGDAGKRALAALRAEVKELRAQLKNQASESEESGTGDPAGSSDSTSEDATSNDGDGGEVATTTEPVQEPTRPKFQGSADSGIRTTSTGPVQLTAEDLKSMPPREVEKARREGRLRDLLGGRK